MAVTVNLHDLMRHECAHALSGLISGSTIAAIRGEGEHWITTHVWPDGVQPTELQTMTAYLCAPILYPHSASKSDRFLLYVFSKADPARFAEIKTIAQNAIGPAVEAITDEQLAAWVSKIEAGETVYLRASGRQ